jgi:hypothetical protein
MYVTKELKTQVIKDYKTYQKLEPKSGGSVEKLNSENSKLLQKHLQDQTYLYIKDI